MVNASASRSSTIIALLALILTLLTTVIPFLYRQIILRPKVLIHKHGFIQLVFGPFGPGMLLVGSLQAIHRQVFVNSMDVVVKHETNEEHKLVWRILYPEVFLTDPGTPPKKDLPVGTMINPQQEFRYNAFFADPAIEYKEIRQIADRVRKEWLMLATTIISQIQVDKPGAIAQLISEGDRTRKNLFLEFMKTETWHWAVGRMGDLLYWREGNYTMTIRAHVSETRQPFVSTWKFRISAEDLKQLKFNTEFAVASLAGMPDMLWDGATVDYLDPS
jgi:hypothetical protein